MSDKKKVIILRIIFMFLILLLGIFMIIGFYDYSEHEEMRLSTTTRRTYESTTKETVNPSSVIVIEPTSDVSNITSTTTTNVSSTTSSSTKAVVSTTKKSSNKTTTVTSPIPTIPDYRPATGVSNHELALDAWEWELAKMINDKREENGLSPLIIAEDLRTLAEDIADKMYTYGEVEVGKFIEGYNNFRYLSSKGNNVSTLYKNTIEDINITSNKYAKYMGIGILYREKGLDNIPTYYYCLIYA